MGVFQHDLVQVYVWPKDCIELREWITALPQKMQSLFFVVPDISNNMYYITMCPDGGKEDHSLSDTADNIRKIFIDKIKQLKYKDYTHVRYGDLGTWIESCHEE